MKSLFRPIWHGTPHIEPRPRGPTRRASSRTLRRDLPPLPDCGCKPRSTNRTRADAQPYAVTNENHGNDEQSCSTDGYRDEAQRCWNPTNSSDGEQPQANEEEGTIAKNGYPVGNHNNYNRDNARKRYTPRVDQKSYYQDSRRSANLQEEGVSVLKNYVKKTILLPLRHFSPIFHPYKKSLGTLEWQFSPGQLPWTTTTVNVVRPPPTPSIST